MAAPDWMGGLTEADWNAVGVYAPGTEPDTPTLDYNESQYGQDYEPNKDTFLSYNDRMRLQMAKDEAIRDSQMTMSLDDALALMGGESLQGQDLSGQNYQDAYEVIADTFENPGAMADMTDDEIIQLKNLSSSQLSGNMYTAALADGGAGAAAYLDTDLKQVLGDASKESIRRYGTGKFAEDYAGSPDAMEAPKVGAGDLADAIRDQNPDIVTRGPIDGSQDDLPGDPYVPSQSPGGGYDYGTSRFDTGGGVQGVAGGYGPGFQRAVTHGGMTNQNLYDTQFSNLLGQQNNFQNQQQMAAGIRAENAAAPPVGAPSDPFSWYNDGKGLPDRTTPEQKAAARTPEEQAAFAAALAKQMAVPGSEANAALGETIAGATPNIPNYNINF